jgi:anti-sigma factor RsiW
MNCVRFEMRLDELLDERLPADSDTELNEHVETCRHCAQLLADHQALLEAIESLGRSEARGDLATRILAEATREPAFMEPVFMATALSPAAGVRQRTPSRAAWAWIAAMVAAALLVGVGVREWIAVHHAAAIAETKAPKLDLPNSVFETPVASATAGVRDLHAERSVAAVFLFADRISPQQRTLMEQMSVGLKPVTHSMSAALNALRRTLPGSEAPARSS